MFVALVALVATAVTTVVASGRGRGDGEAATTTIGVTRTTVTVGGLVGGEPASSGAEIGAQARFARANRRGGVAGRTVEYAGNAADTAAAAATVFAVVPAVSDTLDTATLAQASAPFVGAALDHRVGRQPLRLRVRGCAGRAADQGREPGVGRAAALAARRRRRDRR